MSKDIKNDKDLKINMVIDNLVKKANIAMEEMMKLNQEEIDNIVQVMAKAGLENHISTQPLRSDSDNGIDSTEHTWCPEDYACT